MLLYCVKRLCSFVIQQNWRDYFEKNKKIIPDLKKINRVGIIFSWKSTCSKQFLPRLEQLKIWYYWVMLCSGWKWSNGSKNHPFFRDRLKLTKNKNHVVVLNVIGKKWKCSGFGILPLDTIISLYTTPIFPITSHQI